MMSLGRHGGGWVVTEAGGRVHEQMYGRFPDPEHRENFVQSIRSRELPNADVLDGHLSMALVHYANISLRLGGEKLVIDPASGKFLDNPRAEALFSREYRKPWVIEEEV